MGNKQNSNSNNNMKDRQLQRKEQQVKVQNQIRIAAWVNSCRIEILLGQYTTLNVRAIINFVELPHIQDNKVIKETARDPKKVIADILLDSDKICICKSSYGTLFTQLINIPLPFYEQIEAIDYVNLVQKHYLKIIGQMRGDFGIVMSPTEDFRHTLPNQLLLAILFVTLQKRNPSAETLNLKLISNSSSTCRLFELELHKVNNLKLEYINAGSQLILY